MARAIIKVVPVFMVWPDSQMFLLCSCLSQVATVAVHIFDILGRFFFGANYMEIDLDIHAWAYLARKAFSSYIPRLGTVVFENAFVVQVGSSSRHGPARLWTTNICRQHSARIHAHLARHSDSWDTSHELNGLLTTAVYEVLQLTQG